MLTINNLTFGYPNSPQPYHYNLGVNPSEIVAILGESGSGKSTLLDLIAGFLTPRSGSIELDTQSLLPLGVEQRPISILFQHHNLFEHLSVEKNILLGIKEKSANQLTTILQEVGLEAHRHKIASQLSGGQQQRVGLARVLLRNQPILLLDEPFAGLDSKTRYEMLALVKKITLEKGLHTMMITHEIEDAELIANRVYRIEAFRLGEV